MRANSIRRLAPVTVKTSNVLAASGITLILQPNDSWAKEGVGAGVKSPKLKFSTAEHSVRCPYEKHPDPLRLLSQVSDQMLGEGGRRTKRRHLLFRVAAISERIVLRCGPQPADGRQADR